jgi:hypothetical protein
MHVYSRVAFLQFALDEISHMHGPMVKANRICEKAHFEAAQLQSQSELYIGKAMRRKCFVESTVLEYEWPPHHRIRGDEV